MFQDEAGFGRISHLMPCWCFPHSRASSASLHVREFRYAYGAVDPLDGESYFLVMGGCNSEWMNLFLEGLSETYKEDVIVLVCDNASWHKSQTLNLPDNIILTFIPPYTPEMNPIEQIWKEFRKQMANQFFPSLEKVIQKLCQIMTTLLPETVMSITSRKWIMETTLLGS